MRYYQRGEHPFNTNPIREVYRNVVRNPVAWDFYQHRVKFLFKRESYFVGDSAVKAWLIVKEDPDAADSTALIHKNVTLLDASQGLIEASSVYIEGSYGWVESMSSSSAILNFYLLPTDTGLLTPGRTYYFAVKYLTGVGHAYTCEYGIYLAEFGISQEQT
jgi:hypothetical protein